MLRTGQVHTIGQVAERLGHGYCYGLEFLELNAMEPPAGHARRGDENTEGLHGNGITSSRPMLDPVVIRLDEEADWFTPAAEQRRIGKRMALAATFEVGASAFVACTVHLENRTNGAGRARQMQTLLAALDDYAGDPSAGDRWRSEHGGRAGWSRRSGGATVRGGDRTRLRLGDLQPPAAYHQDQRVEHGCE